ncbi:MAG TPA: endonuclease/exonuclease/phosphatase family protein, partial [Acidimicrobiales bacterium]
MPAFTVTSFNTRWGLDVDDRPYDWMEACASFDTDLIVLQEVWEPSDGSGPLHSTAARLGYEVHHAALSPSLVDPRPEITPHVADAAGTWGVALLSRRPVVATRQMEMGRMFERWDVASRPVLLADVAVDQSTTVTIAAIHLSFALPNAVAQLRRLGGLLPATRPTMVAG